MNFNSQNCSNSIAIAENLRNQAGKGYFIIIPLFFSFWWLFLGELSHFLWRFKSNQLLSHVPNISVSPSRGKNRAAISFSFIISGFPFLQVSAGLVRFASDFQSYQRHFEWLKKSATWLRPMEHDIGTVHTRLERLLRRLEHLVRLE